MKTHTIRPRSILVILISISVLLLQSHPALAGTPGQPEWELNVSYSLSSPALAKNSTLYVGDRSGCLYAINPNGTLKWQRDTGSPITTTPAVYYSPDGENAQYNGRIYIGLEDGRVLAITPSGGLAWTFNAGSRINASPALAADGTIYVGKEPSVLLAITPDGDLKWNRTMIGSVEGIHDPVVGPDGTIYFGTRDGDYFYAYNPDGSQKWATYQHPATQSAAAIGRDGTIYFADNVCLNALWPNGDRKWSCFVGHFGDVQEATPVIGHEDTIYVNANALHAINPDGTSDWVFWHGPGGPVPMVASVAVDSNGLIYAPALDGHIYCIAPGGTFVWRYYAAMPSLWLSAPLVGSDGLLYCADYDEVRALYTGATGPFDGPWPMHRRDAACSARLDKCWNMLSRLKDLLTLVAQSDLDQRVKEHLVVRLDSAMRSLQRDHLWPAIHKLGAFIHYVEAQEGKKIPEEIADLLIRDALAILMLADGDYPWRRPYWRRWDWGRKHHRFAPGRPHRASRRFPIHQPSGAAHLDGRRR